MQSSAGTPADGYSRADRLLHHIGLGFAPALEMSFDLERGRFGKAASGLNVTRPVFVTGLARAGTTVLTRLLHASGEFASLSYRDLPFPLAPNLWARLAKNRSVVPHERGHGDGLFHDLDSPEAIEEVFWRAFEGSRYCRPEGLAPVPPLQDTLTAFATYVRLVMLRQDRGRYLSKNNNNLLRLPALVSVFSDAILIHPFRDPLQQAASLRNQHRRACASHREDRFRRSFMTWLGHHEFGSDHRPFLLPDAPAGERDGIDYWLACWINAHRFLLDQPPAVRARQQFVDYDRLCGETGAREIAGVEIALDQMRSPEPREIRADPSVLAIAQAIHADLASRAAAAIQQS